MKILAFSDLHCDLDQAAQLVAASDDADLVVGAGDFASVHSGLEETIAALSAIETPTVIVPGNNETASALEAACDAAGWSAATMLHGEGATLAGLSCFGLGAGVPTTPWDWSFDLSEEEAERMLAGFSGADLLILHSPPAGHCDRASTGQSLGSKAIAAAIERVQPRLAVCGHIHESWGCRSSSGSSEIANLGPQGSVFEL